MKLSIVVPCFNEEDNIELLCNEIKEVFKKENIKYEVIFINDGSSDSTLKEMKKSILNTNLNIKIINFSRNFGKEAAMYAGLRESSGEYTVIIDADLQQPPALIMDMMNILENDKDLDSVGTYQEERNEGRLLTFYKNSFYKLINRISEINFVQGASDFRIFRRTMVDAIISMTEYYRFSKGIFSWVGFNTHYIPYQANKRKNGKSSWSFWKLFKYAIDGMVSFTTAPLRIATILGIIISVLSFIYVVILIVQTFIFGIDVPGYASTLSVVLLLGGIQLFSLGIIGEYLARTYVETKRRPIYIVKEKLTKKDIK